MELCPAAAEMGAPAAATAYPVKAPARASSVEAPAKDMMAKSKEEKEVDASKALRKDSGEDVYGGPKTSVLLCFALLWGS
jgi:hypothetical protein